MGKGAGVAALTIAILAIFVPLVGFVVSGLAIVLAIAAALAGDRVLSTATALVALVDTFFLSPTITVVLQSQKEGPLIGTILLIIGASPVAIVLGRKLIEDQTPRHPFSAPPPPNQTPEPQRKPNEKPQYQSESQQAPNAQAEPASDTPPNEHSPRAEDRRGGKPASHSSHVSGSSTAHPYVRNTLNRSNRIAHYDAASHLFERVILVAAFENLISSPVINSVLKLVDAAHVTNDLFDAFLLALILVAVVHCAVLFWFFLPLAAEERVVRRCRIRAVRFTHFSTFSGGANLCNRCTTPVQSLCGFLGQTSRIAWR